MKRLAVLDLCQMKKLRGSWNSMLGWTCLLLVATTQPGSTQDAPGNTAVSTQPGSTQNAPDNTAVSCGIQMECTPRKLCDSNNSILRDGRNVFEFRAIQSTNNLNHECGFLQVCCSVKDVRTVS